MSTSRYSAPPARLQVMKQRIQSLYQRAGDSLRRDRVLSDAFEELAIALEEVAAVEAERMHQHDALAEEKAALHVEVQRYQDLFLHAPISYVITSIDGTIRMANQTALALLCATERQLVGRSLSLFVPNGQRRLFRATMTDLLKHHQPHVWANSMQTLEGTLFDAETTTVVVRGSHNQPVALWWLLRHTHYPSSASPLSSDASRRAQVGTDLQMLRQQYAALANASVVLAHTHKLEASMTQVVQLVVPAFADLCLVRMQNAHGNNHLLVASSQFELGNDQAAIHWYTGQPDASKPDIQNTTIVLAHEIAPLLDSLLPPDASTSAYELVRDRALASAVAVPLRNQGTLHGMLVLGSESSETWHDASTMAFVEELAERVATAIGRVP